MAPRPGIEGAKALLKKPEEEWVLMEKSYRDMLKAKGGEELVSLQDEYIDKLTSRFAAVKNIGTDDVHAIISKEEFISVMKWKFRKGKDRSNFLMKGLLSNNEENIQKALHQAIMHLQKHPSDLKGALTLITTLNKVGPASASIFLSMIRPELCCFMDDEVMEVLSPSGKREYTLKVRLLSNDFLGFFFLSKLLLIFFVHTSQSHFSLWLAEPKK